MNDRKMNWKISFILKTSKVLLDVALEMNMNSDGLLEDEFAYYDGHFKRCPGFATLACHVYVEVIQIMVKLFSMETEMESTECAEISWTLFNKALREHIGDPIVTFNPIGWSMDHMQGFRNAISLSRKIEKFGNL